MIMPTQVMNGKWTITYVLFKGGQSMEILIFLFQIIGAAVLLYNIGSIMFHLLLFII